MAGQNKFIRLPFSLKIGQHFHLHRKIGNKISLPAIYAGDWYFTDETNHRRHHLKITIDLQIILDNHVLPGNVQLINEQQLMFIDKYGYLLRIDAVSLHPISVYDEAEDKTYQLSASQTEKGNEI